MSRGISISFLIVFFAMIGFSNNWKTHRKPGLYGDKVSNRMISTNLKKVQQRIVMLHDFFRTRVNPPASNMLSIKWHRRAARSAQNWASQCRFLTHDTAEGRWTPDYGSCGQNIFVSTHKVPWFFAMKTWFSERENFTYGGTENDLAIIGHYSQMIWATTHKVGCGIAKCPNGPNGKTYFSYVCDYCPIGNYNDHLGYPYKAGKPCNSCPNHCHSEKIRLCMNPCNTFDKWVNCKELKTNWDRWLCNDPSTEGLQRRSNCVATCTCHGKIHE